MPCLVLPSPFELLRVGEARSLARWTASRREKFTKFLYMNRHAQVFDERYFNLFFNELVRPLSWAESTSNSLLFLFHQDLAISLQGIMEIYRDGKDWDAGDDHLGEIVKQLPFHLLSDEDLWIALISGCFTDAASPPSCYAWMEPHIPSWWTADETHQFPSQSLLSVMNEWRTCYDRHYIPSDQYPPVEKAELVNMHKTIRSFLSIIDSSVIQTEQHASFIEASLARLTELLDRWNKVAFPGCNTTWNPLSLYRDTPSETID